MRQLINQLQRTACTPRDALAGLGEATPRFLDPNAHITLGTHHRHISVPAV